MELSKLFELEPHGPDTFVGIGPRYPWGGLFGGQIVAQALRAAAATVDAEQQVHSLRAYFIRRGDHTEPIRFEVDRIRNGRSFSTRRVVARQAIGAILNLEASFQLPEDTADMQTVADGPRDARPRRTGQRRVDRRRSIGASCPTTCCRRRRAHRRWPQRSVDAGDHRRSATTSCCTAAGWRT